MRPALDTSSILSLTVGFLFCLTNCHQDTPASRIGDDSTAAFCVTASQRAAAQVTVAQVSLQDVDRAVRTAGRVSYNDLYLSHVFSPVTGRVEKILAHPGQKVRVGDALAVILSPDIGIASSDVEKALADLQQSELELTRQTRLRAQNATSVHDLDAAQDNHERARAEYQRSAEKAALLGERAVPTVYAHPHVGQKFTLRALIEGSVVARHINPGVEIQGQYGGGAAEELFTVADGHQMWVMAQVSEADVGRIRVGQSLRVRVDALPEKEMTGLIDYVANTLDPNTRTATIRCSLPNKEGFLKPNMFAAVSIDAPGSRRLSVPRDAILKLGDKPFVYRVARPAGDAGAFFVERWPVLIDEDVEGPMVPVSSGLDAGEQVLHGNLKLIASKTGR